jgi:hypothetical protein
VLVKSRTRATVCWNERLIHLLYMLEQPLFLRLTALANSTCGTGK